MAPKSNAYWEKRANARMEYYHRSSDKTINTVTKAYDKAIEDINKEIQAIFERYSDNGILSPQEARELLNAPLTRREINDFRNMIAGIKDERIRKQLLCRINAPAYAARITRLQALKEKIYIESKKIADVEIQASTEGYIDTINSAYYKHLFDIQKGLGAGFDVAAMPSSTIEAVLKNPWSGSHFSKRIWGNTDVLADKLTQIVTSGMMSGRSLDKMVKELYEMTTVGKHAAARIIRTETTYMANAAEMESYKEADIDKYIFVATLDLRTSKLCKEHDGQVYEVDKVIPGENMPPLHPNCRSTTIAYFGEENLKGIERRTVDPKTGKDYKIPADMSYEKWYKEKVIDKYGQDQAEIIKKKIINKAGDRKQHERYLKILGNDVPELLDDFQELKYNKPEERNKIKQLCKDKIKVNGFIDKLKNGECNLTLKKQKQLEHTLGHNKWINRTREEFKNNKPLADAFFKEVDVQKIIIDHAGTGTIDFRKNQQYPIEFISIEKPIGVAFNHLTRKYEKTNRFAIRYSSKGVHAHPVLPRKED